MCRCHGAGGATMKTRPVVILIFVIFLALTAFALSASATTQPNSSPNVPKYDLATEATYKGTVEEVSDRVCPVSGGMGSHLLLKLADGKTIEVHLATAKFVKM